MSELFAIAVPILPGKEAQWREFTNACKTKWKDDFVAIRKKHGIRERTFLQHTPMGDMVIVTHEGEDASHAFGKCMQEEGEFTQWFLQQTKEIHGIDLSVPPPGPLPELMIDTQA